MRHFFLLLLLLFVYGHGYSQGAVAKIVISRIVVEGNTRTRAYVILRELSVHEGSVVPQDSIDIIKEQNRLRVYNLQLFNEVTITTTPVETLQADSSGNRLIVLHIAVRERWNIIPTVTVQFADRNFNTWWVEQDHDLRRIMAGLTVTDKNFRGNLEQLAVTVQAGYTQKLGLSYMRPYINKRQTNGLGFSFSVSQSQQAHYATDSDKLVYAGIYSGPVILRQAEGGISYIYRPAYASRHMVQLSYKDYSVNDTIVKLNPEYYADNSKAAKFLELYYRYEYNGVDNWSYSLRGVKLVSQAVVRKGFEGLDFQSYLNVEAGWFKSIAPRWYVATVFRGRAMYPAKQPYYFRGGLGTQTDYVRGYEYYVIDGSHYGLLRLDLKRELYNRSYKLHLKYFTNIPLRIYPKIFADAGYIDGDRSHNNFLANTVMYSIGAGVDVVTLYDIKIRFEFAWNHLKQNGLYLHFNAL
jgi:outer membrane protein assembly factor BamA